MWLENLTMKLEAPDYEGSIPAQIFLGITRINVEFFVGI